MTSVEEVENPLADVLVRLLQANGVLVPEFVVKSPYLTMIAEEAIKEIAARRERREAAVTGPNRDAWLDAVAEAMVDVIPFDWLGTNWSEPSREHQLDEAREWAEGIVAHLAEHGVTATPPALVPFSLVGDLVRAVAEGEARYRSYTSERIIATPNESAGAAALAAWQEEYPARDLTEFTHPRVAEVLATAGLAPGGTITEVTVDTDFLTVDPYGKETSRSNTLQDALDWVEDDDRVVSQDVYTIRVLGPTREEQPRV